jgi:hypothetical protein
MSPGVVAPLGKDHGALIIKTESSVLDRIAMVAKVGGTKTVGTEGLCPR